MHSKSKRISEQDRVSEHYFYLTFGHNQNNWLKKNNTLGFGE